MVLIWKKSYKYFRNTRNYIERTIKSYRQIGINMGQKGYNNTMEAPETTLKEQLLHNRQVGLNGRNNNYKYI